MKMLALGIFLSCVSAQAQILKKILSGNNGRPGIVAHWDCPQESYQTVQQLRNESSVKIFYDKKGNIKFDPDVFKVKTLSGELFQGAVGNVLSKERVAVDYSDCIRKFESRVKDSIEKYKDQSCFDHSDELCQISEGDFLKEVHQKIEASDFIKKNASLKKIPKVLPGTNLDLGINVKESLFVYCSGNTTEKENLLTFHVIHHFRSDQNDVNSELGLVCMKRIIKDIEERRAELEKELCTNEDSLICAHLRKNVETFISSLEPIMGVKEQLVKKMESNSYKPRYGVHEDEEEGRKYFDKKLSASPVKCSDFQSSFATSRKLVRINQLDETINEKITELFDKTDADCGKRFLQNYIVDKHNMLAGDKKFEDFCRRHGTEFCHSQENKRSLILENISKMFESVYGKLGDRLLTESLECKITDSNDPLSDILNKIKTAAEAIKCIDLKEGELKRVNSIDGLGLTKTGNYTLKKVGDKSYQALLNLDFYNEAAQQTTPEQMMTKVKSCLKEDEEGSDGQTL